MEGPPVQPDRTARRHPARRRDARRRLAAAAIRVVVVVVVFIAGLVIGRALEDAPRPGGEQTIVRTLQPSTLAPVETVTITVEAG